MNVQERVIMCKLIEKMENQKEFSKRLCLENHTCFHGELITSTRKERKGK